MKYVDVDKASRAVTWDRYFEYLRTVEDSLALPLRSYARDWAHYSLDGESTLHDSWLNRIEFGGKEKNLTIEFLGSRHDRKIIFRYLDVKQYICDFNAEYSFGDRDVFVHEFRVDASFVTHEIMFANFGRVVVTAKTIIPSTEKLV